MQMKTSATVPNVMLDPAIIRYIQFLRDDVAALNEQVKQQIARIEELENLVTAGKK